MSLSESLYGELPEQHLEPLNIPRQQRNVEDQLADALLGLFAIQKVQRVRAKRGDNIVFQGKLVGTAEKNYPVIAERFNTLGFTAMLEHTGEYDVVLALEGILVGRRISPPAWVHGALLAVTMITTTLTGAQFQGRGIDALYTQVIQQRNIGYLWSTILMGAPFALTLLLILGVHEMGHYVAARRHGVDVTLPFFIPLPFVSILGTLGAVIFIKSPLTNRKALFDVGISGPLAGFVVALITFILSMGLKSSTTINFVFYSAFRSEQIGMPLLLQWIGNATGHGTNLAVFVSRQPFALAAWFGMLLTVLNLLPIGQLDGGHIMYTLFGRFAWTIALFMFGLLIFLGITGNPMFFFYAMLALLTGLRHPPPNDDITPLDTKRRLLGYATIVLFFLIGTGTPFPISFR